MRCHSTNKRVYSANYRRSCRLLRMEFPRLRRLPVRWSPWWCVSTVDGAPLEVIRRYLENHKAVAAR
jgi:putative transposase